jgi:hypothetical protein
VLRIFYEVTSSCIKTPLSTLLEVFEAVQESTFWNLAELFCHGCLNGRNVNIAMAF